MSLFIEKVFLKKYYLYNKKLFMDTQIQDNFFSVDRVDLNSEAIDRLNTYRSWGAFGIQVEPLMDEKGKDENGRDVDIPKQNNWWNLNGSGQHDPNKQHLGTKSLFNNVNAVPLSANVRMANNMPLLDSQIVRDKLRSRGGCSIKDLVEASKNGYMGRAIYNYADFMYCKHLGKVSNNYLITLRRFPFPAGDHINYYDPSKAPIESEKNSQRHHPDVGRLVTWMGTPGNDLNEILKYEVLMPYEEMYSKVQELDGQSEKGGLLGSICNMANPTYTKNVARGIGGQSSIPILSKMLGSKLGSSIAGPRDDSWAYHRDASKPYGPVDVIAKTHIRKGAGNGDGGLKFEQNINLCFDYELKSFDGINGKAAMIDLLSNILAVTYTNGKFWGGGVRSTGASQSSLFTNLPIFKLAGTNWTFNQLKDSARDSVSQIGKSLNNGNSVNSIQDLLNIGKNLLSNIGNMLLGGALNALGRPQKQAMDSFLNNDPVGLWHLTVGNPKHPILSMGNMILDKVEIQQYGPLGLDDFPTGLKVNISLKHGMPRDRMKIEQMYTSGDFRTYVPMGKDVMLMYESASSVDRSTSGNPSETETTIDAEKGVMRNVNIFEIPDVEAKSKEMVDKLNEYFGTSHMDDVIRSGLEGHLGSSDAKAAAQAQAEATKVMKEKEKAEQANQ